MSISSTSLTREHRKARLQGANTYVLEIELKKAVFAGDHLWAQTILEAGKSAGHRGFVLACLQDAAALGRTEIIQLMHRLFDEFLDGRDDLHFAFQRAVIHHQYETARFLGQIGALPYEVTTSREASPSALYHAIRENDKTSIEFLLSHMEGSDLQAVLDRGLKLAKGAQNEDLVKFFEDRGATSGAPQAVNKAPDPK